MPTIATYRYHELPAHRRNELERLAADEFDRFPIVRETRWAVPDWSFLAFEEQDELACFYNLVDRVVRFDGEPVRIAGVNNLVTPPQHKGRGLASRLLRDTEPHWFSTLGASYGLLLCAESLSPFYRRLGWQRVASEVRFEQPGRACTWSAECMVLSPTRETVDPGVIDLCGLPW